MGMVAGPERDKLYAQDLQELTLGKAVELAESVRYARLAAQAAPAGSAAVIGAANDVVFKIFKGERCSVCGYTNHKSNQCRFKSYKCKKCDQKGHLRRMCTLGNKVHFIEKSDVDEDCDGELCYNIRCVKGKPMTERVNVCGTALEFEIDSGSAVSVLSENTFNIYFKGLTLSTSNKKLLNYTGGSIETLGVARVPVSYSGVTRILDMYVVR